MFEQPQVVETYAIALSDAREWLRAFDRAGQADVAQEEFSKRLLTESLIDGVSCEIECSFSILAKRDSHGGVAAACACAASISPASGGECYGQGLLQLAGGLPSLGGPDADFEPWGAWKSAFEDARVELSTDENYQADRALAEAEELWASLREAPTRSRCPL